MTQEEIIQAITETIVPNGQKGITAESLANILLEMVNGTFGGSGAGVPYVYLGSGNTETGELSQTAEQKAHNAEVFQLVKASEVPPPITLDMSGVYGAMVGIQLKYSDMTLTTMLAPVGMVPGIEEEVVCLMTMDAGYMLLADGTITNIPEGES